MMGFATFLVMVTMLLSSVNLASTATLIAPAPCAISAKDPADVTIRIDPNDGWVAKSFVAGRLDIVTGTFPHITSYGYNDGGYPVRGVPVSSDQGTSYTFTFKAPVRRIANQTYVPGKSATPPPPIQPIFSLSHEERGWLRLELFVPRVTGSDGGSGIDLSATNVTQIGQGVYRLGPCTLEP